MTIVDDVGSKGKMRKVHSHDLPISWYLIEILKIFVKVKDAEKRCEIRKHIYKYRM